jgi:DNA-binding transcriptional MerR regulator
MSIGEVLAILHADFPDVTISKIRFLEEQGLVEPERTASGYRKFSHDDVERLRFVLSRQRDQYLPLRVIREHLDALDAGVPAPPLPGGPARSARLVEEHPADQLAGRDVRLTRAELIRLADVPEDVVAALESYGLIAPDRVSDRYHGDDVAIARSAARLAGFGIEPRHLRAFRTAADREAGLVEQVVEPLRRQRNAESAARAEETERELAALCSQLHAALVSAALQRARE